MILPEADAMTDKTPTQQELLAEVVELRARLEEAEQTLHAIRSGEVDALVVQGPQGEQIYTLKGADEPYRVMVETMTEGAVTYSVDGTILYCNARFAGLMKSPLEQTIGTPLQRFVQPHERRSFAALLAQSQEDCVHREINLQALDGTGIPTYISACRLKNGGLEAIAAVVTDLSEVTAAAEARARLALIVESTDDAIISFSVDGVIESWNAAAERMFGYTAPEAVGQPYQQFAQSREQIGWVERRMEIIRGGKRMEHAETVLSRKDGTSVDVSASISPVRNATGGIVGLSAIIRDISRRKHLEAELRKYQVHLKEMVRQRTMELEAANKELESFTYSVSHDLRAPLRAADGFARMVLNRYGDRLDDEGKRLLNVIRDSAVRMGQLIDDLLAFSRLGRMAITVLDVDMESLVHAVLEELKPAAANRQVTIEVRKLPRARGELALLRQVWVNLLSNAIKFTRVKAAAQIEVGGRAEGKEHIYYVKDNGAGFDMRYINKIFDVFQRLHGAEEFEGTGIGLAIVKRIVTRHGGRVWAEGKIDEGATFYFALPASEE